MVNKPAKPFKDHIVSVSMVVVRCKHYGLKIRRSGYKCCAHTYLEGFSSEAQLCRCIVFGRESTSGAILVLWSLKYCSYGKYSQQHSTKTRLCCGNNKVM